MLQASCPPLQPPRPTTTTIITYSSIPGATCVPLSYCSKNTYIIITHSDGGLTPRKKDIYIYIYQSAGESACNKGVFIFYFWSKGTWNQSGGGEGVALLISRATFEVETLWYPPPPPFVPSSCHWEREQQRAAWIHKYKRGGRIYQSSKACTRLHLPASPAHPLICRLTAAREPPRAGDCDQHKAYHRTTQGTGCGKKGNKRIVQWQVIDQHRPSSR